MSKLEALWLRIRDSLWFVPAVFTAGGILLAIGMVWFDQHLIDSRRADELWFIFAAGAEGARGVLGVIAGSIITVTGVTFSVTIVALQLASSQFSPRVLRNFTADRGNQAVLGTFIGTFVYTLLIQRSIGATIIDGEPFVPSLAVTAAVLLALASIGALIYFIDHLAKSIDASVIIDRVAKETIGVAEHLFPAEVGEPLEAAGPPPPLPPGEPQRVLSKAAGYLQAIDDEALFDLAEDGGLVVRMERGIGDHVLPGERLASVWAGAPIGDDARRTVRKAFVLGLERTPHQDVERGISELAEIAVKALSPGINDPTTASICIDHLGEVLVALGRREFPPRQRVGRNGRVVFLAQREPFEHAVHLAFDLIRHFGSGQPQIVRRMLETLGKVAALVPASRYGALRRQAQRLLDSAERAVDDAGDLAAIRAAAADMPGLSGEPDRAPP